MQLDLPFDPNEKIFHMIDEETEESIGDAYSYNDWIEILMDISGIDKDLLGPIHSVDQNVPNSGNSGKYIQCVTWLSLSICLTCII